MNYTPFKIACRDATNTAAFNGMEYTVIGFTEFGLIAWINNKCVSKG